MECHTVESFVDLVDELSPGEAIAYHQGYIPIERDKGSHTLQLKFDRLRTFIDLCYEFGYIEIFTKKVRDMEYRYYARLRKAWPSEVMREVAKDLDSKPRIAPWIVDMCSSKIKEGTRLLR